MHSLPYWLCASIHDVLLLTDVYQTQRYLFSSTGDQQLRAGDVDTNESLQDSYDWVTQFKRLSTTLKQRLSKMLAGCRELRKEALYVDGFETSSPAHISLLAIEGSIKELQELEKTVDGLVTGGKQLAEVVSHTLWLGENHLSCSHELTFATPPAQYAS